MGTIENDSGFLIVFGNDRITPWIEMFKNWVFDLDNRSRSMGGIVLRFELADEDVIGVIGFEIPVAIY